MTLKTYTIHLPEFSIDPKLGLKDYSKLFKEGIRLKNLLVGQNVSVGIKSGRTPSRFNEEYWNGDYDFLTMQDIDLLTFSINKECVDKITDYAIEKEKTLYQAKKGCLIISNAMTLGLSFLTDRDIYINQNVFEINVDQEKANKKFILWYFNLVIRPLFQSTFSAKYLSKNELGRIKIPKIPRYLQDSIVSQIEPIEKKIADLKSQIVPASEIINRVFAREFGFDENICHEFGKGMIASTQKLKERKLKVFETPFTEFARSKVFRKSTRFHNPPTKKLMDFLEIIKTIEIQDILTEDIHRGASPKYDENGEIPVIKTGHLKNGYIEVLTEEFVSEAFHKSSIRSQARFGDILIASTGKGSLGKIDIIEEEEREFVVDGHVSIVRIDFKKYNPLFFVYFFRSILGYFQFERDFTGATNQIELYANEISKFQIPDISVSEQQRIVDEIKGELDKQKNIKKNIKTQKGYIDEIIEKAIAG